MCWYQCDKGVPVGFLAGGLPTTGSHWLMRCQGSPRLPPDPAPPDNRFRLADAVPEVSDMVFDPGSPDPAPPGPPLLLGRCRNSPCPSLLCIAHREINRGGGHHTKQGGPDNHSDTYEDDVVVIGVRQDDTA